YVSAYLTREQYFDIHPPLGKMLIAATARALGYKPGFEFAQIGDGYPGNSQTALRFLPRLAGALVPVLTYACWLALGIERRVAFLAACMILLDNAFLVQSRFVLLDSILLFFGLAGLCLFLQARRRGYQLARLLAAAVLFGLSASVKWTGISFLSLALATTV